MRTLKHITAAVTLVMAVFCNISALGASKRGSVFETPDFAFPQTVEKNANAVLEKALKNEDGNLALRAAIQISAARNLVSEAGYVRNAELFDSLSGVLKAPYSSLALLLEAQVYEGDRDEKLKVDSLVNLAMSRTKNTLIPISELDRLGVNLEEADKLGMSVLDFMTFRAVALIENSLPLLDAAIERNAGNPAAESIFAAMKLAKLSGDKYESYLEQCCNRFGNTPYNAGFLSDFSRLITRETNEGIAEINRNRIKAVELLKSYIEKYPSAIGISEVRTELDRLLQHRAEIKFPSSAVSDRKLTASVRTVCEQEISLLIYKLPDSYIEATDKNITIQSVTSAGKLIGTVKVDLDSTPTDIAECTVELPAMKKGLYTILVSENGEASGIINKNSTSTLSTMLISDIATLQCSYFDTGKSGIYVVDSGNGKPLSGAKVKFYSTKYKDSTVESAVSDKNGFASTTLQSYRYVAEYLGNYASGRGSLQTGGEANDKETLRADILSDLAVYRPGAKMQFVMTAYRYNQKDKSIRAASSEMIELLVRDANWQPLDTLRCETDEFGRCSGAYKLPETGLLGSYTISAIKDKKNIGSISVEVADYKAPNFMVTAEGADAGTSADVMKVSGEAVTYQGMPVTDAQVKYDVTYVPIWWRRSESQKVYSSSVVTDASGHFSIVVPLDTLRADKELRGRFDMRIDVTDASGETESALYRFVVGDACNISLNMPGLLDISGKKIVEFDVRVTDATGAPVEKDVYWSLYSDSSKEISGISKNGKIELPANALRPGKYELVASPDKTGAEEDSNADGVAKGEFIAYNSDSAEVPVETPLWLPVKEIITSPSDGNVSIKVGSSYPDSYIMAEISDDIQVLERRFVKSNGKITDFDVSAPESNRRKYVTFVGIHDYKIEKGRVEIIPQEQNERPEIIAETFRDHVTPGARENWKFKIKIGDEACGRIAVMAVMTDKALNSIIPFKWNQDPYSALTWWGRNYINIPYISELSNYFSAPLPRRIGSGYVWKEPDWNLYGQRLSGCGRYVVNTRMMKMAASADLGTSTNDVFEESAVADLAASKTGGAVVTAEEVPVTLRETDRPVAFFMPDLQTNTEGDVEIAFETPEFVGTWQFQIAAYTKEMKGSVKVLDVISSKNVMVKENSPRFLRTGDRTAMSAQLFNNSDSPEMIGGRIVIKDASSGDVIAEREFATEIVSAAGSRVITLEFDVPSELDGITSEVYAISSGGSDGERNYIAVLPATTPVTEAVNFWLAPGEIRKEIKLPPVTGGTAVTLQYCTNPIWECVKSLPSAMNPESGNVLTKMKALYAGSLASGLFKSYPEIGEALKSLDLSSPLGEAQGTPWVNSAKAETERMRSLTKYLNAEETAGLISVLLEDVTHLCNEDGGWSWCPGMESSAYITRSILSQFATLNRLGYMPEGAGAQIPTAVDYCDAEFVKDWKRNKKKYFSVTTLLDYLYSTSAFPEVKHKGEFAELEKEVLKKVECDWRDFDIYHKATAAIWLDAKGKRSEALTIMESLRQYASSDTDKGVWYDNLRSSGGGSDKLLITSRVLQAYGLLEPENPIIDGLRQWLVLSRETEDWGADANLAEVTAAILRTGSRWISATEMPEITLNGRPVLPQKYNAVSGSFDISISPEDAGGATLSVTKRGEAPSWGGVVMQYVAPVKEVREVSTSDIAISKKLVPTHEGKADILRKGDRVKVILTVKTDKDMDYVVIHDNRAACLEPEAQLSEYAGSDGVRYYREVLDASTNLYIPFLPRGTHRLEYECHVDRAGEYSLGIAGAQSLYAPTIAAHSSGAEISIKE